jgi:hypothetical protein
VCSASAYDLKEDERRERGRADRVALRDGLRWPTASSGSVIARTSGSVSYLGDACRLRCR